MWSFIPIFSKFTFFLLRLSVLCRVWGTGLYQMCLLLIFFLSCLVYSVIIIICGVGIMPSKQELNHCSTSSAQILMKSNMSVLFFSHKISPLAWCLQHHHKAWGHKTYLLYLHCCFHLKIFDSVNFYPFFSHTLHPDCRLPSLQFPPTLTPTLPQIQCSLVSLKKRAGLVMKSTKHGITRCNNLDTNPHIKAGWNNPGGGKRF